MTENEAIGILKDYRKGDFVDDYKLCEAIDTVVASYEEKSIYAKPLLCAVKLSNKWEKII